MFLQIILQKCLSYCKKLLVALHYILRFSHFCFLYFNSYCYHGSPTSRPLLFSSMKQQKIAWTILHIVHALLYFLFHSMHVIIYKKDIFDKVIDSLCVQNIHYDALCIVHERIYTRLIYHLLIWIYSYYIQTFSCSFSSNL